MSYKFFVAGVKFHKLHTCIDEVKVGDNLVMVAEPSNPYDSNAVRLEFASQKQDAQIMTGYVPKTFSASVTAALLTDDSLECVVTKVDKTAKTHLQLEVEIKSAEPDVEFEDDSTEESDVEVEDV